MKSSKNPIIPLIISFFCLWTILNIFYQPSDIYSILSVIIGVTSVILYYKDNKNYDKLFYVWVYMQVPNITYSEMHIFSSFPMSFGLGLGLTLKGNEKLELYFNILPIAIYYIMKYFNVDKPIGAKISINRLRKGTFPQVQFPVNGTVKKVVGRSKMTAVYLIELENSISIKDKTYEFIFLEPKDNTLIQITDKWQVEGLRICKGPELPYHEKQDHFVDWVTIKTE